jgi:hypothetical protein
MSILHSLFPGGAPEFMRKHKTFVKELKDTQAERICKGTVEGCEVVTEPYYTDRRHDRAHLKIDGESAGIEWTSIPWSCFKPITVSYWMYIDYLARDHALALLKRAGVEDGWVQEDPYADPVRWGVHTESIESAVKVWKEYKTCSKKDSQAQE